MYRELDTLLEENAELIAKLKAPTKKLRSTSGFNLIDVKNKNGFDLTPLFIGSQGTLGIITEVSLKTLVRASSTTLTMLSLENKSDLSTILPKILELKPAAVDMISRSLVERVAEISPSSLKGLLDLPQAEIHLFVEFDQEKESDRKKSAKRLKKVMDKVEGIYIVEPDPQAQEKIWKVRQSVAHLLSHSASRKSAVPVAEDISVAAENYLELVDRVSEIYDEVGLAPAFWGHVGEGVLRMQPLLNLGLLGDRQKLFRLSENIYQAVNNLGGSLTAGQGDGRVRAPFMAASLGQDVYELMLKVKQIFDPYGTLNTGVKTASIDDLKASLRGEYNLNKFLPYLPRS